MNHAYMRTFCIDDLRANLLLISTELELSLLNEHKPLISHFPYEERKPIEQKGIFEIPRHLVLSNCDNVSEMGDIIGPASTYSTQGTSCESNESSRGIDSGERTPTSSVKEDYIGNVFYENASIKSSKDKYGIENSDKDDRYIAMNEFGEMTKKYPHQFKAFDSIDMSNDYPHNNDQFEPRIESPVKDDRYMTIDEFYETMTSGSDDSKSTQSKYKSKDYPIQKDQLPSIIEYGNEFPRRKPEPAQMSAPFNKEPNCHIDTSANKGEINNNMVSQST